MERVDVYSETGKRTGKTVSKEEAHQNGIWHKTIHLWLVNSRGELLIQRRSPRKDINPNKWGVASVGGHINAGENSLQAAVRETKEEINLELDPEQIERLFTTPHQITDSNRQLIVNHFDDSFLSEMEIDLEGLTLQPEEVSEIKLIHFTELQEKIEQKHPEFAQHQEYQKLFPLLRTRYG